jgi:hypothetical protein
VVRVFHEIALLGDPEYYMFCWINRMGGVTSLSHELRRARRVSLALDRGRSAIVDNPRSLFLLYEPGMPIVSSDSTN